MTVWQKPPNSNFNFKNWPFCQNAR